MVGTSYRLEDIQPYVDRLLAGEQIKIICREAGISPNTLKKHAIPQGYVPGLKMLKSTSPPPPIPDLRPIGKPAMAQFTVPCNATVLAIPDLHCPFEHPDALAFICAVRDSRKTTLTVCMGDEIDAASFSRYIPDPDGLTPGKELALSIEHLLPFYREFPDMLVCESNHTVRPWKKAFDAGLPASFLPTYSKLLNAPDGWIWKPRWEIDGVLYIHGDNGKSGAYAHINYMKAAKRSVVIGHIHSYAGVNYEGQYFGVNTGCLIDETAYCFKYAKNMLTKVNLGCGVIYEGKYAEFIPMRLNDDGRWIGHL